jgi:prevent-host-death family protein
MTRTITLKEAQAAYSTAVAEVQSTGETLIVEQEGKPTVVVIPFSEYQQLVARQTEEAIAETWQRIADAAWCQEQLSALRVERETFKRLLPELLKTHADKFIAIQGESVLDSDIDERALARRMREQGQHPVYIDRVTQTPSIIEFPSPEEIHGT